ncbi:hypothetical protein LINGRAPRIM_LOCUS2724 [Linum grandiflorum]
MKKLWPKEVGIERRTKQKTTRLVGPHGVWLLAHIAQPHAVSSHTARGPLQNAKNL